MTVEQREKVQRAIEALIDVESALHAGGGEQEPKVAELHAKLHEARTSLILLNAPDYN